MTPILLWIDGLENRYWSIEGRLRGPVNDSQIMGYGYCALGVLCDLFLKHAPDEAARAKARWEDTSFIWEENGTAKAVRLEPQVPAPVAAWWQAYHALDLEGIIAFNDLQRRSFGELAMYLRGTAGMHYLVAK